MLARLQDVERQLWTAATAVKLHLRLLEAEQEPVGWAEIAALALVCGRIEKSLAGGGDRAAAGEEREEREGEDTETEDEETESCEVKTEPRERVVKPLRTRPQQAHGDVNERNGPGLEPRHEMEEDEEATLGGDESKLESAADMERLSPVAEAASAKKETKTEEVESCDEDEVKDAVDEKSACEDKLTGRDGDEGRECVAETGVLTDSEDKGIDDERDERVQ
ncbi:hypothetical protein PHYPSEUDO_008679 [Phytophthora pseudosyringae]|uniref:Uncharacterized protein n=1 Tax=Phytophthora pseudosyringae TaxID=221518 RepID=A0A8T1VDI8_9STRA|nr:hypothetical protein PHYPSEUDO_008679 [Phytophthora pseudosyringae]